MTQPLDSPIVTYNGYTFGRYAHVTIDLQTSQDDAQRTVTTHTYRLRVDATIHPEAGDSNAGGHFGRIRRKLTKQGGELEIHHAGFSSSGININGGDGIRDVRFGPIPRVVRWLPVGDINAVEVTWECEFSIPACDDAPARHTGVMAFNYSLNYRINKGGYTTRIISGYIEIAMTRIGRRIPDTADSYRELVNIPRLINFERETSWNISADKRRADFSIVDREIETPHAYPAGVISIRASHSVMWNRRQMATLPQEIRATIELAQNEARGRAWEIFKAIVESRTAFALTAEHPLFFDGVQLHEDLYANVFTFALSYRTYVQPKIGESALAELFTATGIGSDLARLTRSTWDAWNRSVQHLQSHRGWAQLAHDPAQDEIVDLCSPNPLGSAPDRSRLPLHAPTGYGRVCNVCPHPSKSYLRFDSYVLHEDEVPTTVQVTIDEDDMLRSEFDPDDDEASLGGTRGERGERGSLPLHAQRYVEGQAGPIVVTWKGYAERVCYPIPKPDKLKVDGYDLTRYGKGKFIQRQIGTSFCRPVYAAAWELPYVVSERPKKLEPENDFAHF